ncbi:LuxR C-terminal-related transcriptional regulator [Saccharothrix sp. Mg75]|uniref:response regulator transcription factor n=1 Tax=Saccharothrix sp. Mg75 TaxID=3445357 RepID=UPI003EF026BB
MSAINVAVHAADPITRAHLADEINSTVEFQLVAPEGGEAVDGVVVASVDNADMTTLEMMRDLRTPRTAFCLIVRHDWYLDYSAAVEHGVRGVLWRADYTPARLRRLIHVAHQGQADFPNSLQAGLLEHLRRLQEHVLVPAGLTPSGLQVREVDMLRLMAEGMTLEEISKEMSYSERTVKNIFYGLMKRLNLRNRTHAVSYAIRAGLI